MSLLNFKYIISQIFSPDLLTLIVFISTILLISLVDFITLFRVRGKEVFFIPDNHLINKDFTILIPIFGDLKYLKNVDFLKQYGKHVVLCTTTKETKIFNKQINDIAEKYKFRIFKSEVPLASKKHKPNPWTIFTNTLHGGKIQKNDKINQEIARDEIIRDSFKIIRTKYCIFLDGDTTAKQDFGNLVYYVNAYDYDICSVRVLASRKKTLIEKLQSVEYELAMDARKIYPWLTSGAAMIAKTVVIKDIMSHHSLFFSGGDIEIGKLARILKYNVGYANFVFYTDVPETFKAWFKQRMVWCGGGSGMQ